MSTPLTSWKEIAQHMNKSVRTVQRWEAEFGLPVRRPEKPDAGSVLAFPEELDLWMHQHTVVRVVQELEHEVASIVRHPQITGYVQRIRTSTERGHAVRGRSTLLLHRTDELLAKIQREMTRLKTAVDEAARLRRQAAELTGQNGHKQKARRLAS